MHRLEDLDEVQLVLQKLIEHDPPLVRMLPRQPGTKEARYVDLFSSWEGSDSTQIIYGSGGGPAPRGDRIARLEAEVAQLRVEFEALRQEFANFRSQFEP
jgi:hypothetical protein